MLTTRHGGVYFEYKDDLTLAYLHYTATGQTIIGNAICAASDRFERRIGRKVALTRAIKTLPRQVRGEIWEDLWKHGVGK